MAYTPVPYVAHGDLYADTDYDLYIADNMAHFAQHTHSGDVGDPEILVPYYASDKRSGQTFTIPNVTTATMAPVWHTWINANAPVKTRDGTNKFNYWLWGVTSNGGNYKVATNQFWSTEMLPIFGVMLAQETVSANCTIRLGFSDGDLNTDPSNGIFFRNVGGNWFCVCRNGGTEGTVDTGVAAVANTPKEFRIVVASTGSVQFYIDRTLRGTISNASHIPAVTALMEARIGFTSSAAGTYNIRMGQTFGVSGKVKSS